METKGNQMLTIYGCRKSKSGSYLNVTLVRNEVEKKVYFTACVKLDNSGKVKAKEGKTKEGHDVYVIAVPVLTPKKTDTTKDDTKAIGKEDLPF